MIKEIMFKKIDEERLSRGLNEPENSFSSNRSAADQNQTVSNVISLADEKKKQQRELLLEKLRKDGFLEQK